MLSQNRNIILLRPNSDKIILLPEAFDKTICDISFILTVLFSFAVYSRGDERVCVTGFIQSVHPNARGSAASAGVGRTVTEQLPDAEGGNREHRERERDTPERLRAHRVHHVLETWRPQLREARH